MRNGIQIAQSEILICLDERGKIHSSKEIAKKVEHWQDDSRIKTAIFLVGGPYGLEKNLLSSADETWSLSLMTLPSDLAWLVLCEQLYRAFTIIKGMPYHHE